MLNKSIIDQKFTGLCCLIVGETEFAVGLKYETEKMNAPIIIFQRKSNNEIIPYCIDKNIPIIKFEKLVKLLLNDYKTGDEIKEELYVSIANIFRNIQYNKAKLSSPNTR